MIYNLAKYLIDELPTLSIIVNSFQPDTSETAILLLDNGGTEDPWYNRKEYNAQVISRSPEVTVARLNIYSIYNKLNRRFGLSLPSVTVDGELYPSVIAYQISPNQIPGYLGADDKNLQMWSVNFRVITA